MANNNFVVQNGLTVGTTTIFAGNGDIILAGNVTTTGSGSINSANGFGGLSPNQIYSGAASNVTVSGSQVTIGIAGYGNVATFTSTGLTIPGNFTVQGTTTSVNTETATTINATTLQAVTIGNSGAILYGTLNSSSASQPNITTLGGVTSIGASSATTITGTLQTAAQTNITSVGTLTGLTVSGAILASTANTVNIGSTTNWFNNIYGTAIHSLYADLAENYVGDKSYAAGTVVMFGGTQEVTVADPETTAVAGIVSTNPSHLMNGGLQGGTVVPVALTGRVPCMIIGPVAKGDLLVSAGYGYAKSSTNPSIGTVVGKALVDFPSSSKAVIEVAVGRY